MQLVSMMNLVSYFYKDYVTETTLKRHMPYIYDGNKIVHIAILLAMKELCGKSNKAVASTRVTSLVASKYHLHSNDAIYMALVKMSEARMPFISVRHNETGEGVAYNKYTGVASATRYIDVALSPLGMEYVNHIASSPIVKNYTGAVDMPQYFTSLFPNFALKMNTSIIAGKSAGLLPCCPKEIFDAMLFMLENNFDATTYDLMKIIKGFDLTDTDSIYMTSQSLYDLIETGDCKATVLSDIVIQGNTLYIIGVPPSSSHASIKKRLVSIQEGSGFETVNILGIKTTSNQIRVEFQLKGNFTEEDFKAELYRTTKLRTSLKCEYIGMTNTNSRKVHKISLKDVLRNSLYFGYKQLQMEINQDIDNLNKTLKANIILEKITRPNFVPYFESILHRKNDREELCYKYANDENSPSFIKTLVFGDLTVQGGLTKEEIEYVFSGKKNFLGMYNKRDYAISGIRNYLARLAELKNRLKHENLILQLKSTIQRWSNMKGTERQSKIFYCNVDDLIQKKRNSYNQFLERLSLIQNPKERYLVVYKDNTFNFTSNIDNMEDYKEIKFVLTCTTDAHQVYILTDKHIWKINTDDITSREESSKLIDGQAIKGAYHLVNPKADFYIFVTNLGRIKKLTKDIINPSSYKVKGFTFMPNEEIIGFFSYARDEEANLSVETITEDGMKRFKLGGSSCNNKAGYKSLFAPVGKYTIKDCRLVNDNTSTITALLEDNTLFHTEYLSQALYKRNVSKAYKLEILDGFADMKCYIDNKFFYFNGRRVSCIQELLDTTGISPTYYTLKEHGNVGFETIQELKDLIIEKNELTDTDLNTAYNVIKHLDTIPVF